MVYKKLTWIVLSLMIIITGCSYGSNGNEDNGISKRVVPVEIAEVGVARIENKYFTVSRVESLNSVIVTSQVEGEASEVFIKPGDRVDREQLLYRIMFDENFKDAKLKYESAAEEKDARNKVLIETKDQFDKMSYLYEQGTISESKLRETRLELEQSKIQLNTANQTFKAALEVYNMLKNRYEVKSPIAGYVSIAQVKAGQNVTSEQIIKINGESDKIVEVGIPEEYIGKVTLNTESRIKVNSANKVYDGKVIEISPEIDRNSGLYPVKVKLKNEDGLMDGLYAEVELILSVLNDQIMIPNKAIVFEDDRPYIFKLRKNNSPLKTEIEIGIRKGGKVQVSNGLKRDDVIIIKGQHFIDDNSLIEVMNDK